MTFVLPPHRGKDFVEYLSRARVAASFWEVPNAEMFSQMCADGLEIAEFRLDLARMQIEESAREILPAISVLPTILTIRGKEEGGIFRGVETVRCLLYRDIAARVSAVDIELRADICAEVVAAAKELGAAVIISRHNLRGVDSAAEMNAAAEKAFAAGADVFKMAALVQSEGDFALLESFLQKWKMHPVVVIGMGDSDFARRTRLEFPARGSRIAFARIGEIPSAPGQLSIAEIAAAIRALSAAK